MSKEISPLSPSLLPSDNSRAGAVRVARLETPGMLDDPEELEGLRFEGMQLVSETRGVKDYVTLSVRREQIRTVERVYRFVGSNLHHDLLLNVGKVQAQPGTSIADEPQRDMPLSGLADNTDKVRGIGRMIELTIYILAGGFIALLISPLSPFQGIAEPLAVVILPLGAAIAVIQAFAVQYRRRDGG